MVHELDATLDHIHIVIKHRRIDNVENIGMWLILSIEDGHHIATRHLQSQVQPMRFVNRLIIKDKQLDVWIA